MTISKIFFFLCLICCVFVLWPLYTPIFAATIAAFLLEPVQEYFLKFKFFVRRKFLLSFLICSFVSLVFLVPLVVFLFQSVSQAVNFFNENQASIFNLKLIETAPQKIQIWLENIGVSISISELLAQLKEILKSVAAKSAEVLQAFAKGTPEGVLLLGIFFLAWQVLLCNGKKWRSQLLPIILPWENIRQTISETSSSVIKAVVLSNIIVSFVQSVLVAFFLLVCSIPNVFLLSGLSFFASFIPIVGTAPIFIISAITCFSLGNTIQGVVLLFGMFIVGLVDNILRPYLVKGGAELSFFWLFLSFIGGVSVFGVAGVIIGPILFSLFNVFLKQAEPIQF
jgi:predicted PurR-regulated permease PerM